MIIRKLYWILLIHLIYLLSISLCQNARSYDTSEWIPITPSSIEKHIDSQAQDTVSDTKEPQVKRATGRVLNLDAPAQKFFPDEDYRYRKRRPSPDPYHDQKGRYNVPKYENGYKFIGPPPPTQKDAPGLQYTNEEIKLQIVDQPPPLSLPRPSYHKNHKPSMPPTREKAPAPNAPSIYERYHIPLNNTYYEAINPAALNQELYGTNQNIPQNPTNVDQELLGAIQKNHFNLESVGVLSSTIPPVPLKNEKETVQLVYVPLENLKNNQPLSQDTQTIYRQVESPRLPQVQRQPLAQPQLHQNVPQHIPQPLAQYLQQSVPQNLPQVVPQKVPQTLLQSRPQTLQHTLPQALPQTVSQNLPLSVETKQHRLESIQQDFITQALQASKLQKQIQEGQPLLIQTTTTTTPKPKKRKPHQPPLAVYMESTAKADISEVLEVLKDAKSIAVQDSFQSDSPQIFIGPSTLNAPEGYNKFPLPYLNSIDGNRVERKVDGLPFFVAPLSYKTPNGYSKIPLPSPHVGSVVISNKNKNNKVPIINQNQITEQQKYNKQNGGISVLSKPQLSHELTPQRITDNQNYNKGQSLSTSQPEYLQYNINNLNNLNLQNALSGSYLQQPQFASADIPSYNLPNPQILHTDTNSPFSQYNLLQNQNIYLQPNQNRYLPEPTTLKPPKVVEDKTRKNNELNTKELDSSTVPNYTLESQSKPYLEPHTYDQQSVNEETKHKVPVRQYPNDRFRSPNQNVHNEEAIQKSTPRYETVQQHIPSRVTPKYSNLQEDENNYNIRSRPTERDRYLVGTSTRNYDQGEKSVSSTVSITPRNTTPKPAANSEGIINTYYIPNVQKPYLSPLDLAINEYELHQINTQLEEKPKAEEQLTHNQQYDRNTPNLRETYELPLETEKPASNEYYFDPQLNRFANTPTSILRDTYETTARPTKARRRGRPTKTTTTTEIPKTKQTYTILEDFSAKSATPQYTQTSQNSKNRYTTIIEEIPANVYTLQTTTTENYREIEHSKGNRHEKEKNIPQHENIRTEIEELPAKVYSLNVQDSPVYSEPVSQTPKNQHALNQQAMDQKIFTGDVKYEDPSQLDAYFTQRYGAQSITEQTIRDQTHEQEHAPQNIEPLVHNRGQVEDYVQPDIGSQIYYQPTYEGNQEVNQVSDDTADIVKSLQDQSVRSLLIPNLLAPTTENVERYEKPIEISTSTTTTTTTTTEKPTETTTHARTRSRTRGGTRFSQTATTTRRSVSRRRPVHSSRTTTERAVSTTDNADNSRANTKQRFRTRGRTTPSVVSERISTTENEVYNFPTSEAALDYRKSSKELPTYSHREHVVDEQRVITNRPEIDNNKEYHTVYAQTPDYSRPILQYENTATTPRPQAYNVQITQPVTETENRINVYNPREYQKESHIASTNQGVEDHTQSNLRTRTKIRGRVRPTTTTTTERHTTRRVIYSTTPPPAQEEAEEFYGFFRAPNFKTPAAEQTQIVAATQQPQFYSNSFQNAEEKRDYYGQHPQDDLRLRFDNTKFDATTVHFVGEIKPKYPSTTIVTTEYSTETPRPRIRSRIRTSSSKKSSEDTPAPRNHRPSYQTAAGPEQVTRRTNVIRSRGRTHYKPPETLKATEDPEADIEGGNYPVNFFQQKQPATAVPSFQITIDPPEVDEYEDQAPHSSIYRPRLARPDEWHEASEFAEDDKAYASDNQLDDYKKQNEESDFQTTTEIPLALPVKASTEELTTDTVATSEEMYRENQKAMDDLFETVNKFDQVPETTTEKIDENKNSRRRGIWKLVRQRPVDNFQGAESQNYQSVLNLFDNLKKENVKSEDDESSQETKNYQFDDIVKPTSEESSNSFDNTMIDESEEHVQTDEPQDNIADHHTSSLESTVTEYPQDGIKTESTESFTTTEHSTSSTEGNIFDSFYSMFGLSFNKEDPTSSTTIHDETAQKSHEFEENITSTTTLPSPTFPDEITDQPNTTTKNQTSYAVEMTTESEIVTTMTPETPKNTFPVEPWEMKKVRTSTSTEVSHETEICYKGKCIKSRGKKTRA